MTDLRYDYSKIRAAGEAKGFGLMEAAVPLVDARLSALNLTQEQVDGLGDLYADLLTLFTTGKMPDA